MKKEYNDYFLDKAYFTPDPLVEDLAKNMKLAVTSGHTYMFIIIMLFKFWLRVKYHTAHFTGVFDF